MPIYLDPNPLNACCSSAGPPLSLQIILNSVVVFQFGQKLHQNHCMERQCIISSSSSPLFFFCNMLPYVCSYAIPWDSPQLFCCQCFCFVHVFGREPSTEPVLSSKCNSSPERRRNSSNFERELFWFWFSLLCILQHGR